MKHVNLNYLTIYSIFVFIFIVVGLHLVQKNYNPVQQLMSELALGEYGYFMLFAFLSFAVALVAIAFILIILSMYLIPRLISQFSQPIPIFVCWFFAIVATLSTALGHDFIAIGIAQRVTASSILLWLIWASFYLQKQMNKSNND